MRKILHIDMDAFFAQIEQRENPEFRGLPIAVGGDYERGVISTASYEARRFGVHSAMSTQKAKELCRDLIIIEPHFKIYKQVSSQIMQIFHEFTDIVEQVSIDEAFLDITHNKQNIDIATLVAQKIKERIYFETFLTCSAGVSYNKFLAKIASDWNKPNGLFVIPPSKAQIFIDNIKVEKIWGIGAKTKQEMNSLGIFTGKDLREKDMAFLVRNFGKQGRLFYDYVRGIDYSELEISHVRKSIGCEHTMDKDISKWQDVTIALYNTVLELERRIKQTRFKGKTLTLKVKFYDFNQITRTQTQFKTLDSKDKILPIAKALMKQVNYTYSPIRLIGLSVSNPKTTQQTQLELFPEY